MEHEIVDFETLDETVKSLLRDALEIRKRAYCPYSNFAVGTALRTDDNIVYTGCNIENAALSPSICAERAAISKAVCDGHHHIRTIAIIAHQETSFTAPCGVCRQTLNEFRSASGDIDIYLSRPTLDKVLCTKLSQILPLSFVSYTRDSVHI